MIYSNYSIQIIDDNIELLKTYWYIMKVSYGFIKNELTENDLLLLENVDMKREPVFFKKVYRMVGDGREW